MYDVVCAVVLGDQRQGVAAGSRPPVGLVLLGQKSGTQEHGSLARKVPMAVCVIGHVRMDGMRCLSS